MSERDRIGFHLYLITEGEGEDLWRRVARALAALPRGLAAVQLRAKQLAGRALLDEARRLRALTRQHGAALFVNDRLDVALAAAADGVHLPGRGLPVAEARRLAPTLLIGASTHGLREAEQAQAEGADLVTFGPVFATPSKAGMGDPLGTRALAQAAASLRVPVFALGGVDGERAPACVAAGARLACIRAVLGAADPGQAASQMARALEAGADCKARGATST